MRPDLPTGTVTFLFTDVEGSTRLLHELGAEAYAEALAEHRALIREACGAQDGVEVDTQGDAFFFAFPQAEGALRAATAFTDALSATPIRVRCGLHTGTPLLASEGYVGSDVHFAARVAACGHGGQVLVSAATAALVEDELSSLGAHRLKDIAEAVALYQAGEGSFPPLKTIANTNLPTPASSFLGREEELYEADLLLQQSRLLTIAGPGGQGKTRFALELATRAREEHFTDYEDGVFSCFFSSLRDPALVLPTLAHTLSVSEQAGASALETLSAHLQGKKLLLLLDNLEHLLEAAPELSQLLAACPSLTLLVTSRELLRIQGEEPYALPPLASEEGIALFCERAHTEPTAAIASLCARLEGLPLALELAAARTAILTPAQLEERIGQRLDLLKAGRDADPRQQTLRATIEWSYDLLTPEEQQLFACLSVFQGGCTLEAAEDVAEADLDLLHSLVDKSLLRFSEERFWMLETIREYAWERLDERGKQAELRQLHAVYFVDSVRTTIAGAAGPDPREWGYRFEPERANLRAAMAWALEADHDEDAHILATAYGFLCRLQGPYSEGRSWLGLALKRERGVTGAVRQRALRSAAGLAELQRDHGASLALGEESLALARLLGDPHAIGAALVTLGVAEGSAGNFDRAESLEREALEIFAASGNEQQVRQTLGLFAWVAIARGNYEEAQEVCERALQMSRDCADDRGIVLAAGNLGHVLSRQGKLDEALPLLLEALHVSRANLDLGGVADTLVEIASLAIARRQYEEAAITLGASDAIRETTGLALDLVGERLHADALVTLRAEMPSDLLASATARGRELDVDDIVAYATEALD